MSSTVKIGFIGTGVMGTGMAMNLLKGGYPLAVYNRTKEKAAPLIEKGAVWKNNAAEIAECSDIVITIVGYPSDVEQLYFGNNGILSNIKPGSYAVDMTTSKPSLAVKIYEAAEKKSVFALDAPVSGGDTGARNGTLAIMVGGSRQAYEKMRPLFALMGKNIVFEGRPGAGQNTKMCNQIAIAANIMGTCESLAYAQKAGLDPENVLKCISTGAAASWQMNAYVPRILAGDFKPGFYIRHFIKDLRIAIEQADEMGLRLPAVQLAKSLYERLAQQGMENCGTQALIKLYE